MADNKLIKISSKDWHYRLIKFCWGINPSIYRNLCPYFWLTIASLFTFVPVALYKCVRVALNGLYGAALKCVDIVSKRCDKMFGRLSNKLFIPDYETEIRNLTKGQIYYIYCLSKGSNVYEGSNISHFSGTTRKLTKVYNKNCDDLMNDIKNIIGVNKYDASNYVDNYKREIAYFRAYGISKPTPKNFDASESSVNKILNNKIKEEERAKKMEKITKSISFFTEKLFLGLLIILCVLAVFLVENLISLILSWLFTITEASDFIYIGKLVLYGIAIICTGILLGRIFAYLIEIASTREDLTGTKGFFGNLIYHISNKIANVFVFIYKYLLYYPFYKFIYKTILVSIGVGFVEGFNEFGGIFSDYFNASYSDYCPGIEWEEKKDSNN